MFDTCLSGGQMFCQVNMCTTYSHLYHSVWLESLVHWVCGSLAHLVPLSSPQKLIQ